MTLARQPIFVDESIHDRAGFILTAIVAPALPIDDEIDAALITAGLIPGRDEYKSSARMFGNPNLQRLRSDLLNVMFGGECRLALVISDRSERASIATHVVELLEAMVSRGRFSGCPIDVHLDQGISCRLAGHAWRAGEQFQESRLLPGQDSRLVRGLQLADMCAHNASTILLADLGYVRKTVLAGESSGFDADTQLELEFTLWASLRHCLASEERAYPGESREPTDFAEFDAFGLFVSDSCSSLVKRTALDRFAAVYMGCIH